MFESREQEKKREKAERAVNYIIEKFDFKRVQKTMEALAWSYSDGTFPPTVEQLARVAEEIIRDVAFSRFDSSKDSGGFRATKCGDHVSLAFEVSMVSHDLKINTEHQR
jgi:hypothetical protein